MPRYAGYPRVKGTNLIERSASKRDNYKSLQTAQRRHDYLAGNPNVGAPAALLGLDYFGVTIARFRRSFGAGTDDLPTPTSGNNYQTPDVMNGSEIRDLQAKIRISNKSTTDPAILTVYKVAWSFYDGYVQLLPAGTEALGFTTGGTPNAAGQVDWATLTSGAMNENTILNSKFLQHFYQKLGDITLGQEGTGKETVEININGIPSKCKRSQTGMFFGYIFANDSDKNEGRTLALDYSFLNHFIEIPSENRLPWLA